MKGKNVLIFGAAGFIGTYLADHLVRLGCDVVASDISELGEKYYRRKGIPFVSVDITRESEFARLGTRRFDAVIHLAACQPANTSEGKYDPRSYINVNVIGTLNILDFCRKSQSGKIIYASSHRNTQALWDGRKAIREDDGQGIKFSGEYSMFSISESAAQNCVTHYHEQYGLRGIIFRLPPVYGYGPHTEIFKDGKRMKTGFQVFIEKAIAGKPLEIWGDGNAGRDIIYVKDVVSALQMAIENTTAAGLFNIASGRYLTLREQAETIADLYWGADTAPEFIDCPDKQNDIDPFLYDITKAERELGWRPAYAFRDMLIDYQKELERKEYEFLIDKRKAMFN